MGSAGMALGPDGKPLKRKTGGNRGMVRPPMGMPPGMAGRPMRGGPMMNPYGRPAPYGMMGPMGYGNRGPMPFAGAGGAMGYNPEGISFFNAPQPVPPLMGDARTGSTQPGQQVNSTPANSTPASSTPAKKESTGGGQEAKKDEWDSNNGNKSSSSADQGSSSNSSIHELFGKMVWKKMEGLKDDFVIDHLQNRIMNLIHEALARQAEASNDRGSKTNGL